MKVRQNQQDSVSTLVSEVNHRTHDFPSCYAIEAQTVPGTDPRWPKYESGDWRLHWLGPQGDCPTLSEDLTMMRDSTVIMQEASTW